MHIHVSRFVRTAFLCAGLPLLAGCASGPTFSELHASEPVVATDSARIYFYRESSMVGSAIQPSVYVNGVAVGSAVPGGYFYVDRPGGEYEISTTTEKTEIIKANIKPGDIRYVRLDIGMGVVVGHILPTLVMPEQGESEIAKCHFVTDKPKKPSDKDKKKPNA
jgi:hypothetical protein